MRPTQTTDHLLTIKEVSEILQVPVNTLRNWRYRGEGPPAFRVGRHTRYLESDVTAWIEAQRSADRSSSSTTP